MTDLTLYERLKRESRVAKEALDREVDQAAYDTPKRLYVIHRRANLAIGWVDVMAGEFRASKVSGEWIDTVTVEEFREWGRDFDAGTITQIMHHTGARLTVLGWYLDPFASAMADGGFHSGSYGGGATVAMATSYAYPSSVKGIVDWNPMPAMQWSAEQGPEPTTRPAKKPSVVPVPEKLSRLDRLKGWIGGSR